MWSLQNSKYGDDCYVCQRHNYVQLFYNRDKRDTEYQRIDDPNIVDLLKETFEIDELDQMQNGSPIFISSFNNWVLTRLIDVRLYTYLLKDNNDEYAVK